MKIPTKAAATVLLAGLLAGCAVQPQATQTTPAAQAQLTPDVAAAMRELSDTLASAKALTVNMTILREGKLGDQTILLGGTSAVAVRRPDRLATLVGSDVGSFSLWYDGSKVTVYNPTQNVYSVTPLQGNIDTALSWVEDRLDIEIPIRPLLLADPYAQLLNTGTTGVYVGPTFVRGVAADHYAMRSPGVDWEIWISAQGPKTPRRVSVVDKTVPNQARVIVDFDNWNLSPRLADANFTFSPPRGAVQGTPVLLPE